VVIAEAVTARPIPPLRPLVRGYIGYRQEGFAPGVHRGLPGSGITLVIPIGAPLSLAWPGAPSDDYDSVVGGLHAGPVHIHHDGTQFGVQLDLEPLGARLLFGMPAAALTSVCVPCGEVLGPAGRELVDRLQPDEAADWPARFAALDAGLLAIVTGHERDERPPVAPEVTWAWRRLRATNGGLAVADLAEEVGWSRRHLSERFRVEVGLPPKVVARVLRFEQARGRLRRPGAPDLATIAAEAGYYDQAHLTRDFNELAGCSPSRWLIDEQLPFVQDDAAPAGAP
jgi:AraC-like DNA-binding protein